VLIALKSKKHEKMLTNIKKKTFFYTKEIAI